MLWALLLTNLPDKKSLRITLRADAGSAMGWAQQSTAPTGCPSLMLPREEFSLSHPSFPRWRLSPHFCVLITVNFFPLQHTASGLPLLIYEQLFFPLNNKKITFILLFYTLALSVFPYSLWFCSAWIPRLSPARRWECSKAEWIIPKFHSYIRILKGTAF